MNRILRRPMFRTGGSAEGITSGLQPRQKYSLGRTVNPFERTGNLPGGAYNQNVNTPKPDAGMSMIEKIQSQRNIINTLAPRQPRTDTSMRDFLINFGLDIASRPPSGSIFSTAAGAGKEAFGKFQQAKQMEQAYGMKETEADRALIADMIKGMDEDKLSALMRDVKAGVEAGLFADEKEGIRKLLQKKIYGVLDEPGEAKNARIRDLELMIARDQEVPAGMVKAVAEHIYKIETNAYPEEVMNDLNRTRTFIKPLHMAGVKRDEDGEISEIQIDANFKTFYVRGQIYFDAQSGDLFKNVSVEDEAPRFVRVDFE
jgi:hypothetical protein